MPICIIVIVFNKFPAIPSWNDLSAVTRKQRTNDADATKMEGRRRQLPCHTWLQHSPDDAARAHMPPIRKGTTLHSLHLPSPAVLLRWLATLLAASNGNSSSSSCYWGTLSLAMAMATMAMEAYNVHNALKRAKNFRFSEHNILRFHGSLPHAGKWKIHCHIHTHTPYPDTHTLASESDILVCSFFGKSFEALGRQR